MYAHIYVFVLVCVFVYIDVMYLCCDTLDDIRHTQTLSLTATHCNALQNTATQSNTPAF